MTCLSQPLSWAGYYNGDRYPSLGEAIFTAVTIPILATWGGGWGGYSPGYWGGGYWHGHYYRGGYYNRYGYGRRGYARRHGYR